MFDLNHSEDFPKALRVMFHVVQSSCDDFKKKDAWYVNAHALSLKFFRHLSSMHKLCIPHIDSTTGDLIVDHSTASSINRAAFETYLVFSHIFATTNKDLSRLRFALWSRGGMSERLAYAKASEDAHFKQLEQEQRDILALTKEINESPLYLTEYTVDQRKVIEKGHWSRIHKPSFLAKQAGVSEGNFQMQYKFASGHSHSSYISALQVSQARDPEIQQQLVSATLSTGLILITYFLEIFSRMSPEAEKIIGSCPDAQAIFSKWNIRDEQWIKDL